MQAKTESLRWLGEGKKLTIPFFQRNYVWEKKNWDELLYNFDNIDTVMPFIGSIIVKGVTKALGPEEKIIIDILNSFVGKSMQIPPMYSAIKINGKKLYEYAREGVEVEIPSREIEVFEIELYEFNMQTN